MTDRLRDSVFAVTSSADEYKDQHGSGFLIHRDASYDYVLTCRHVLRDVGGLENARVAGCPLERVVVRSWDSPDDLAVLMVKTGKLPDSRPLELEPAETADNPFLIFGYYRLKKGNLSKEPVNGHLNGHAEFTGGTSFEIKAWKLDITSKNRLREGYSGSPVIDAENQTVLGVAGIETDRGEKGFAIAIETLSDVWEDMPESLRAELSPKFESDDPYNDAPKECFDPFLAKLCDRDRQFTRFRDFFESRRKIGEHKNRPQFYIIHGNEWECSWSLVERFKYHVGKVFDITPLDFEVISTQTDTLRRQKDLLVEDLFEAVREPETSVTELTVRSLCELPNITDHPAVIIRHCIDSWQRHYGRLFEWYVTQFWNADPDIEDGPLFLVFFTIEYPNMPACGFWRSLFESGHRQYRMIQRGIRRISGAADSVCVIPEITPVSRQEVNKWYARHIKKHLRTDEREWRSRIKDEFGEENEKRMAEVEKILEPMISQLDHKRFENT